VFLLLIALFCIPITSFADRLNTDFKNKPLNTSDFDNGQDVIVKGKVTDASTGQTLPGVTVQIKGSRSGTVSDINGNFTISAPDIATLVFSFVGFDVAEVAVKGKNFLNVTLRAKPNGLNEVVVVGYGTQKKTSTTAAVSTVSVADIAQKPIVNLTNGLVGRAAGLIATQGNGEPGFDGSGLLIRGPATTGRTSPLTVVDGVPRDFSRLDPNSIETITVLKDAAAVAPYGVAGANGVILITTKSGKAGKPTLTYNGYYGIQNPTNVPRFVNSYQYALLRNEAAANDGTTKPYSQTDIDLFQNHLDPDGHADGHPLEDIILKNRPVQYHNMTMSGGTEDIKYFASIGYNRQDGMWSTTFLNKYNGSLGITANATKTTTVNLRVNSYLEEQHFPSVGAGSILGQAQRQNPTYPVRYSNGLAAGYIGQSLWSQIYDSGYTLNKNTAWLTQLSIDQKLPLKGLSIKGIVSYDIGPDPLGFSNNNNSVNRTWQTPMPFTNPYLLMAFLLPVSFIHIRFP
jgi:TonB-linked SusC/RagA family outer membrane protein